MAQPLLMRNARLPKHHLLAAPTIVALVLAVWVGCVGRGRPSSVSAGTSGALTQPPAPVTGGATAATQPRGQPAYATWLPVGVGGRAVIDELLISESHQVIYALSPVAESFAYDPPRFEGSLQAVHLATGAIRWKVPLRALMFTTPQAAARVWLLAADQHGVLGASSPDGNTLWLWRRAHASGTLQWKKRLPLPTRVFTGNSVMAHFEFELSARAADLLVCWRWSYAPFGGAQPPARATPPPVQREHGGAVVTKASMAVLTAATTDVCAPVAQEATRTRPVGAPTIWHNPDAREFELRDSSNAISQRWPESRELTLPVELSVEEPRLGVKSVSARLSRVSTLASQVSAPVVVVSEWSADATVPLRWIMGSDHEGRVVWELPAHYFDNPSMMSTPP